MHDTLIFGLSIHELLRHPVSALIYNLLIFRFVYFVWIAPYYSMQQKWFKILILIIFPLFGMLHIGYERRKYHLKRSRFDIAKRNASM